MAKAYNPIGWENGTKEADAYVTIGGVDYEVTPEQWDGNTPVDATNLDHMEKGIQNSYDVKLLAVTDTEPSECAIGDVYYNTTNKLLYTATGTDTWSSTGTEPLEGILYIVFDEENNQGNSYSWNGSDLSSVGGGNGGSSDIIIVEPDEPTEETKLVIEEEDLDFQYQTGDTLPVGTEVDVPDDTTIPAGWEEVSNPDSYSTNEVKTNKTWINGKPIYRKVIDYLPSETMGAFNQTTNIAINHNISNFEQLVQAWCVSEVGTVFTTLASTTGNSVTAGAELHQVSNTQIGFRIINDTWGVRHYYFILEYTKTTD